MSKKPPVLTTSGANPVADNQNSLTAGARGPKLLQDYQLIEDLAHQNREPIKSGGFAIKFYTPAGNWDLVGANSPNS